MLVKSEAYSTVDPFFWLPIVWPLILLPILIGLGVASFFVLDSPWWWIGKLLFSKHSLDCLRKFLPHIHYLSLCLQKRAEKAFLGEKTRETLGPCLQGYVESTYQKKMRYESRSVWSLPEVCFHCNFLFLTQSTNQRKPKKAALKKIWAKNQDSKVKVPHSKTLLRDTLAS